ncbi:MAG: hypothetical protein K6A89_01580 [Treponema sp.]|nr:hypothetical protein [Treponema sp.]
MRRIVICFLIGLFCFNAFCYDSDDFSFVYKGKEIALCDSQEDIFNEIGKAKKNFLENPNKKEPEKIIYYYKDFIIKTWNSELTEFLLTSKNAELKCGLKVGDSLEKVKAFFYNQNPGEAEDYQFNSFMLYKKESDIPKKIKENINNVLLYVCTLPQISWQTPQYFIFFIYDNSEKVVGIDVEYYSW